VNEETLREVIFCMGESQSQDEEKLQPHNKKIAAKENCVQQIGSSKKRQQADNKEVPVKRAKTGDSKPSQDPNPKLSRLVSTYGSLPVHDLSLDSAKTSKSERILALLLNAMLSSARISHSIAHETVKCVTEAKYHHLDVLEGSTWEERTQVLMKGGYTHYLEKTAAALEDLARLVRDRYGECTRAMYPFRDIKLHLCLSR